MLTLLPAELTLQIIKYIPTIKDKMELRKTCRHFQQLLSTRVVCWNTLDFSPFHQTLNNSVLLSFLKNTNIFLFTLLNNDSHGNHGITGLNLSGCWNLSQDMVVAISTSFPCLHELYLNGYNTPTKTKEFDQEERMHLYQVRPSHDLSSMSMDLSKKRKNRLNIPYILISKICQRIPHLQKIEIQYQDLSPTNNFSEFKFVSDLDISSCYMSQASIQNMLRHIGHQLVHLKMLNIELNNMTWLCLGQYGKSIHTLHVSCNEPNMLSSLKHTIRLLNYLEDLRITRIRTGSLDGIIETLNPNVLKKLDVSPKMNIYPKVYKKHPPQKKTTFATTEHDLIVSRVSFYHLTQCCQLTELRLCFPTIQLPWLQDMFPSLQQLHTFELRLSKERKGTDYLKGLHHLFHLERIYLYSVFISMKTIESLGNMNHLKHITMTSGGQLVELKENQSLLLNSTSLVTLNIGTSQSYTSQSTWNPCVVNDIQQECQNLSFFKKETTWHVT